MVRNVKLKGNKISGLYPLTKVTLTKVMFTSAPVFSFYFFLFFFQGFNPINFVSPGNMVIFKVNFTQKCVKKVF